MEAHCLPKPEYRQRLNHAIQVMLSGQEESDFPPILRTINRRLKQYKLQGRIAAYEVFSEACDRAYAKLERCEEIHNIYAWFRTTCFYIVSEWSRQSQRTDSRTLSYPDQDRDLGREHELLVSNSNCLSHLDILAMIELFNQLPELDKKILGLYASGLQWDEVADRLIESGEQSGDRKQVSQSIAQRASRARKRLRSQYFD